jgi:predicted glycosyltransferase
LQKTKTILVAPLDWGIGHATRCIPIIRYLLACNCKVILASSGKAANLLKVEFPELQLHIIPSYNIEYPINRSMFLSMLLQTPKIINAIKSEQYWLKKFLGKNKIDAIISDNRYGIYSKEVYSVFVTHQLQIQAPFAEGILNTINALCIKKFTEVWVPDCEGELNLSGKLSYANKYDKKIKFIGVLSRFSEILNKEISKKYNICVVISGPEPQRTAFENIVLKQLNEFPELKSVVIRGFENKPLLVSISKGIEVFSHLPENKFFNILCASEIIICRSGYSTLMDFTCTGNKAVLVPTPGQTEQEYLANYHKEKGNFFSMNQKNFSLKIALENYNFYSGIYNENNQNYKLAIDKLLENI